MPDRLVDASSGHRLVLHHRTAHTHPMTTFLLVFVGILVAGAIAAWFFVGPDENGHDEMRRAGQPSDLSPDEAARRATGRGGWTRPDGGGLQ